MWPRVHNVINRISHNEHNDNRKKYCLAERLPFLALPDLPSLNNDSHSLTQVSVTTTPSDHYLQEGTTFTQPDTSTRAYITEPAVPAPTKTPLKLLTPCNTFKSTKGNGTQPAHSTQPARSKATFPHTDSHTAAAQYSNRQLTLSNHTRISITLYDDLAFIQQRNLP